MVKLGFAAQNTHLRPYSIRPPYFWFCRSCTQLYSSSASRVSFRLEDKVTQGAKGLASSGAANADVLELKQQSNYSTFQQNERKMQYGQRNKFSYYQLKDPCSYRGSMGKEEDWVGAYHFGHTAEEWDRATQDCKKHKILYAIKNHVPVHIGEFPEKDITKKADSQKKSTDERKGGGLSMQVKEYNRNDGQQGIHSFHQPLDQVGHNMGVIKTKSNSITLESSSTVKGPYPSWLEKEERQGLKTSEDNDFDKSETECINGRAVPRDCVHESVSENLASSRVTELHKRLGQVYNKVLVVDSIPAAKKVVGLLTNKYRNLIHACDTEVANINVKEETPVNHGEIICFSIYSGPDADFGEGKSCVWVDVLDGGGKDLLEEFAPFFEDQLIKKVWHNYSFDNHIIENYGVKLSGFYADTMHMARLWNSSRRMDGGYSLEALSGDSEIMSEAKRMPGENVIGKVSMKTIFGRKKLKKDGSEGKLTTIPSVTELQRDERKLWICYSALDSISTLMLYESLERKLRKERWSIDGHYKGSMFNFYQEYLCPFGELLVKMETEGMQVNRSHLAEIEKLAKAEQQVAADRFRKWASKYCPDAKYLNVGSDIQLRQFFFGGVQNSKDQNEFLPVKKEFKIPNVDNIIEEGKKSPSKMRKIVLYKPDGVNIATDNYTASGWPSLGGDALKNFAGKVSADFDFLDEDNADNADNDICQSPDIDTSTYGAAYTAFGGGQEGIEACHAIAALCEVCSIDSLISNFILPLQGYHISGKDGRIHCSLNINTETGRLSARRPNLQNQPALEKDRYKIRQAFIAETGNSLVVADYGQLELRILAHLANCKSMLQAFEAGGDFHSRTAMNMYPHIRDAVEQKEVLLEWNPQPGEEKPPVPLLKDAFASERRKAKMLNFSIAYGKTSVGLSRDWKVSRAEAQETVDRWYSDRQEVLSWQRDRKEEARRFRRVYTLLGRARHFPSLTNASNAHKGHIERAAINTPVQGSAADVAMCAMLEISKNARLQELGWKLILQVHDEVILEGPTESAEEAKGIVVDCMSKPFNGENFLRVDLAVDAKCAKNWYTAK